MKGVSGRIIKCKSRIPPWATRHKATLRSTATSPNTMPVSGGARKAASKCDSNRGG